MGEREARPVHPALEDAAQALEAERTRPMPPSGNADDRVQEDWLRIVRGNGSPVNERLFQAMRRKVTRMRREYSANDVPITFSALVVLLVNGGDKKL